jgi:hypothetical protein
MNKTNCVFPQLEHLRLSREHRMAIQELRTAIIIKIGFIFIFHNNSF